MRNSSPKISNQKTQNKYWLDFLNKNLYKQKTLLKFMFLVFRLKKMQDIIMRISIKEESVFVENHENNSSFIWAWSKKQIG